MHITRRKFLLTNLAIAISGTLLGTGLANAQSANLVGIRSAVNTPTDPQQVQTPEPYRVIGPIPMDAKIVRYFFQFSCSFCASYHDRVAAWSRTLPKGIKFDWMPVVVDQASANMAVAFAAARLIATPVQLDAFMKEAYRAMASGQPANQAKTWDDVANRAGIRNYRATFNKVPDNFASQLAEFERAYELDRTPTMVIGGKYLITPDSVNGNDRLFMTMANALVSKAIMDEDKR
jgi:thiol:disulfide interchange protein DsbA